MLERHYNYNSLQWHYLHHLCSVRKYIQKNNYTKLTHSQICTHAQNNQFNHLTDNSGTQRSSEKPMETVPWVCWEARCHLWHPAHNAKVFKALEDWRRQTTLALKVTTLPIVYLRTQLECRTTAGRQSLTDVAADFVQVECLMNGCRCSVVKRITAPTAITQQTPVRKFSKSAYLG